MFEGTFTALVTPFTATGELDSDTLRKLVDRQIEAGITGLVAGGHYRGEPYPDQRGTSRGDPRGGGAGRGPGAGDRRMRIEQYRRGAGAHKFAKEAGAEASLHVAGYYNKPSATGFLRHFQLIADSVDLPLIVYNIPGPHRQEHRQPDPCSRSPNTPTSLASRKRAATSSR